MITELTQRADVSELFIEYQYRNGELVRVGLTLQMQPSQIRTRTHQLARYPDESANDFKVRIAILGTKLEQGNEADAVVITYVEDTDGTVTGATITLTPKH